MNAYDIICKKRNNSSLSGAEITYIVEQYTAGTLPDYQMAAFLMAVYFRGMDYGEMSRLTLAMTESGEVLDLSDIPGVKVDKHSTGGVGDGTSLVIAPLVASAGVVVPMMSGRSLGHTGGTLDKLESIPGFRTDLTAEEFRRTLKDIGVCMIGQTEKVAPADKKIYALRDVTGTVDSIPLIAASILSKKLSEGCDALILDVKAGSGAFMKTAEEAQELAKALLSIGSACGLRTIALITDMNQPLGKAVGNAIEVRQAIEVLTGGGPADLVELSLTLSAHMLVAAGVAVDKDAARERLIPCLKNGRALMVFEKMIIAQGGDPHVIDRPKETLPIASHETVVRSPRTGYVDRIDTQAIGLASVLVGAGRLSKDAPIDKSAGIIIEKKHGDFVKQGEALCRMYSSRDCDPSCAAQNVSAAYSIQDERPEPLPLIYAEIIE